MNTVAELVSRARRMLRGSKREPRNTLAQAAPSGQAFLIMEHDVAKISVGNYLGVGAEVMYVTARDVTTKRVDVERGVDDTPQPVSHPVGTRVENNWRFLTADLLGFLVDEIRSWPDGIFVPVTTELTIPMSSRSVDLPLTRFRFPLKAVASRQGRVDWVPFPTRSYEIQTGLPTSQFPSGNAFVVSGGWAGASVVLHYAQALDLSAVGSLTTDTDAIGFSEHLYDAALHGIAWRALAGEEADRSNDHSQPEPRNADEVDPFDAMRAASAYKAIRDLRLEEEKRRLRQLYGLRGV